MHREKSATPAGAEAMLQYTEQASINWSASRSQRTFVSGYMSVSCQQRTFTKLIRIYSLMP